VFGNKTMKKEALIFFVFFLLISVFVFGLFYKKGEKRFSRISVEKEFVRQPAVAGSFYPAEKQDLEKMVEGLLAQAQIPKIEGSIKALIVPHASYSYSGWVAAYAYKTLIGKKIKRVILIGNSHQEQFEGASVYSRGYYRTPLGDVEIDEDFAKKLIESDEKVFFRESIHLKEHSLEVQLPFLQNVLIDFKIVPIIIGNQKEIVEVLVKVLKNLIDENTLIIASSDLSHYPKYEDAQYVDNKVIGAILSGKREDLKEVISQLKKENIVNLQTLACGQEAIEVVMGLMENENVEIKLLKYANSGDIEIGDKSRVVGYAAIAFIGEKIELGEKEKNRLLEIARQAVESYVREGRVIEIKEDNPVLNKHQGVFVTIKKHDRLRGCIGTFEPEVPLYQAVRDMAISAATKDIRFYPVTENELDELEYEISVLSPLEKIDNWQEIEIGKHGVQIRRGLRSGVFLPQVATENNWDLETFLSVLCQQKAGLRPDCYKDKETEIYIFTAQVFGEKE